MVTPKLWTYAYCRTCGHNVRVAYTAAPTHEGHANIPDGPELVCIDATDPHCIGTCPLSNLSHQVMDLRLSQSELADTEPQQIPNP
jgi:hypothetical protein